MGHSRSSRFATLTVGAALVATLAGCGGDSDDDASGASPFQPVSVDAGSGEEGPTTASPGPAASATAAPAAPGAAVPHPADINPCALVEGVDLSAVGLLPPAENVGLDMTYWGGRFTPECRRVYQAAAGTGTTLHVSIAETDQCCNPEHEQLAIGDGATINENTTLNEMVVRVKVGVNVFEVRTSVGTDQARDVVISAAEGVAATATAGPLVTLSGGAGVPTPAVVGGPDAAVCSLVDFSPYTGGGSYYLMPTVAWHINSPNVGCSAIPVDGDASVAAIQFTTLTWEDCDDGETAVDVGGRAGCNSPDAHPGLTFDAGPYRVTVTGEQRAELANALAQTLPPA